MIHSCKIPFEYKKLHYVCLSLFGKEPEHNRFESVMTTYTRAEGGIFNITYPLTIKILELKQQARVVFDVNITKAYMLCGIVWMLLSALFYFANSNLFPALFLGLLAPIFLAISIHRSCISGLLKLKNNIQRQVNS